MVLSLPYHIDCSCPFLVSWARFFLFAFCQIKQIFLSFISIYVTKANLVFTQLKPSINVFSNNLTCSALVGRTMQHLLLSICTQLLNELAEFALARIIFEIFL